MIKAVGIDTVECNRFDHWVNYNKKQLQRIFTPAEITYSTANPTLASQRLAVRFAAKEAFYKALCAVHPNMRLPLLTVCPLIEIIHQNNLPTLNIDWKMLAQKSFSPLFPLQALISLTHTKSQAMAIVILQ